MVDVNGVKAAIKKLNGTIMDGKEVIVELSKPKALDPDIVVSSMGLSINYVTGFSRFFYPFHVATFLLLNVLNFS